MTTAEELLRELAETATALGPAITPVAPDELLRALTDTAREVFGAAACSLALLSEDESELVYTTAAGAGASDVTGMRMPSNRGIAGYVVRSGLPLAVSDVRNDARFSQGVAEQTGYVPQSIVAVPVTSATRTLGVLSLLDRDESRGSADKDMRLLGIFANQAAMALESVNAFRNLGRVLLLAVAEAAGSGSSLAAGAEAVAAEAARGDHELVSVAEAFAGLAGRGVEEQRLAAALLADVATYLKRRSPRIR
jgi:GAF domain-containing protein